MIAARQAEIAEGGAAVRAGRGPRSGSYQRWRCSQSLQFAIGLRLIPIVVVPSVD